MCEVKGFTCMLGYFFELIRRGGTIIGGELLNFEGVFVTIWGNMKISEKKVVWFHWNFIILSPETKNRLE